MLEPKNVNIVICYRERQKHDKKCLVDFLLKHLNDINRSNNL